MISSSLRIAMLIAVAVYFALLILLVKKRELSLKYSIMWFAAGFFMLLLALLPAILDWFAHLVGIVTPVNALFAVMFFFVIIILVALTSIATKLNERVKTLTQNQALLEQRIRELEKK